MSYFEKYKEFLPNMNEDQMKKLDLFFNILIDDGVTYGVVGSAPSAEEFWLRHIADSLFILQEGLSKNTLLKSKTIFDVGSGAGLPGIALAIMCDSSNYILVDSSKKRTDFSRDVCAKLNVTNVEIKNSPAEELSMNNIKGSAAITFRAFRKPLAALELILNILQSAGIKDGKILYWRSRPFMKTEGDLPPGFENVADSEAEQRVQDLGFTNALFYRLHSPQLLGPRGYYYFEYSGKTKKGYPRSWARIKKDQLIERIV